MKSVKAIGNLFCSTLLLTLVSCSDSTQFTEKTTPADLDSIEGGENPTETNTGSENPETVDTETPDVGLGSRPEKQNPDTTANEDEDHGGGAGSENPGEGSVSAPPPPAAPATNPTPTTPVPAPVSPDQPIFASCDGSTSAIMAQVFVLPAETKNLPNFDNMSAVDDVCISQLNIANRDFDQGFPGVQDLIEWFGLDIRYRVYAPIAGNYTFTINSDDGSKLWIDNALIINNDGQHAQQEKTASVNLTKGWHEFHVAYFQGPRYSIALELFWKMPGQQTRSYIPAQYLSRPVQ